MSSPVSVTLLTRAGCHLCDDARAIVEDVCARVSAAGTALDFSEVDITSDPGLTRRHAEDIPVVLINGRRHSIWRVDPERLTEALHKAAGRNRA